MPCKMSEGGEVECPSCGHGFVVEMEHPEGGQDAEPEKEQGEPVERVSFADALRKRKQ